MSIPSFQSIRLISMEGRIPWSCHYRFPAGVLQPEDQPQRLFSSQQLPATADPLPSPLPGSANAGLQSNEDHVGANTQMG